MVTLYDTEPVKKRAQAHANACAPTRTRTKALERASMSRYTYIAYLVHSAFHANESVALLRVKGLSWWAPRAGQEGLDEI